MEKFSSIARILILLVAVFLTGLANATDRYWFSFTSTDIDGTRIMQIDALGNVVKSPKILYGYMQLTSLSYGNANELLFWSTRPNYGKPFLHLDVLDRKSLKILRSTHPMNAPGEAISLQATQYADPQFLAFESPEQILQGFPIDSRYRFTGEHFRISPRTEGSFTIGGVSADGKMAWCIAPDFTRHPQKLFLQPLRSNGHPNGAPSVIASATNELFLTAADITKELSNGRRFVLYRDLATHIYIQVVDAETGRKIGIPKAVATPIQGTSFLQELVIDPEGHFFLFVSEDNPCENGMILFQALDANGNTSGSPKPIIKCEGFDPMNLQAVGLDLLKE